MRIGVNLFLALMFTVMGVVYQPIIEKPIEIYYDTEVTHTATDYSYKPGQSGTEYEFYLKRSDRGYDHLGFFAAVGIPTLFYFGAFMLIGLLRRALFKRKPIDENHPRFKDNPNRDRFLKIAKRANNKNNSVLVPLACVFAVTIFFMCGRYQVFGLGLSNGDSSSKNEESAEQESFDPNYIVYMPNGKGNGDLWLVEEDKDAGGASFIENESTTKFDSIIYTIRIFRHKTKESTFKDRFIISDEYINFDLFAANENVWVMSRPNFMRVYKLDSDKMIYESTDDFTKKYNELKSGIHEMYRLYNPSSHTLSHSMDIIRMKTLDGGLYYYKATTDEISENVGDLEEYSTQSKFDLKRANGDRYNLEVTSKSHKRTVYEENFFINGDVIYQNEDLCLIYHRVTVADDSPRKLTCANENGEILWEIDSKDFPHRQPDQFEIDVDMPEFICTLDGKTLVIIFRNDWMDKTDGVLAVDIDSGKIKWKYDHSDLKI